MSTNMTRRSFMATATALSAGRAERGAGGAGLRARLLGAWRLLDAVTVYASGATGPWYDRPGPYTGLITYGASGAMSVQIASARPPARSPPEFAAMGAISQLRYLHSYYAYFGRFEVDETNSEVRHFVDTSLDPTESGSVYIQKVRLAADRMTLTTQPWKVGNELRHSRLLWARA